MIHGRLVAHADKNRSNQRWRSVFDYAKEFGFDTLRGGVPWNKVWLDRDRFDWSRLDQEFEYAEKLGLTIVPILAHMSWEFETRWMDGRNGVHPLLRRDLFEIFAEYTTRYIERYARYLRAGFIPIVEVGGEGYNHFLTGMWEPHRVDDFEANERSIENLVKAFNAGAAIGRQAGVPVIACEARECLFSAIQLDADIYGVNFYTFAHTGFNTLPEALVAWRAEFRDKRGFDPVFALLEWGSPEDYYLDEDKRHVDEYQPPGKTENREKEDQLLLRWLTEARELGIDMRMICRYLVGNFWHGNLTVDTTGLECDRNALIDVHWNPDKSDYDYVPCHTLARRFQQIAATINAGA